MYVSKEEMARDFVVIVSAGNYSTHCPPHIPETTLSKVTLTDCENITLALECVTWLNVHMFSQIWLESRQNSINALFLGVYFLRLGHGDYNG